jgi:ABC-type uncharacterized transport system auxiliary subunit
MPATGLSIRAPSVPPGFETDRIALYMDGGRRFDYYAGGRWPAHLEDMLQETILRSVQAAWPTAAVTAPNSPQDSYMLDTDIIDFQPVYSGAPDGIPALHVKIRFTLRSQENTILDAFMLEKSAFATSNSLTAITAGLEILLQDIILRAVARLEPHMTPVNK